MGKQLGSDREAMGAAFGKSESLESLLESRVLNNLCKPL